MDRLKKLENREPVSFKMFLDPSKNTFREFDNIEKMEKRYRKKMIDDEYNSVVRNRMKNVSNYKAINQAKVAHKNSLEQIEGVQRDVTGQIVPMSIFQETTKIGDVTEVENPFIGKLDGKAKDITKQSKFFNRRR